MGWWGWVDLLRTGSIVAEAFNGLSPAVELVKSPMSVPHAVNLPLSIAEMEKAAWPRSVSLFNPDSRNGRVVGVTLVCDLHHE